MSGQISVHGIDINYITVPTGEPDKRYPTKYAFGDSNGDDIPELHLKSSRYYIGSDEYTVTGWWDLENMCGQQMKMSCLCRESLLIMSEPWGMLPLQMAVSHL